MPPVRVALIQLFNGIHGIVRQGCLQADNMGNQFGTEAVYHLHVQGRREDLPGQLCGL